MLFRSPHQEKRNDTGSFDSVVVPSCVVDDSGVVVEPLSFASFPEQATNVAAQAKTVAKDHIFFT